MPLAAPGKVGSDNVGSGGAGVAVGTGATGVAGTAAGVTGTDTGVTGVGATGTIAPGEVDGADGAGFRPPTGMAGAADLAGARAGTKVSRSLAALSQALARVGPWGRPFMLAIHFCAPALSPALSANSAL